MTASRTRSSRWRDDRGSATAETAVVLPVVVVLVVLLAMVGLGALEQVRLESGARAAARELARGEPEGEAVASGRRAAGPAASIGVRRDGDWVRVEATRTLRPLPGGMLAGVSVTLRADAVARLEPQLLDGGGP